MTLKNLQLTSRLRSPTFIPLQKKKKKKKILFFFFFFLLNQKSSNSQRRIEEIILSYNILIELYVMINKFS